jgi:hypothetical protein
MAQNASRKLIQHFQVCPHFSDQGGNNEPHVLGLSVATGAALKSPVNNAPQALRGII